MKAMHQLIRVPEIQKTMQEMSKEMMKVCTILQRITDTLGYGISIPAGINMPARTFDKTNKRASWETILCC